MDFIWKASALALISVILYLILAKKDKDMASILTFAACGMVLLGAFAYFEPIIDFFGQLQELGSFDSTFVSILLKASGIGLITEITALLCSDLGNSALGKTLQIAASAVILWLSLPLFSQLLSLLAQILGKI